MRVKAIIAFLFLKVRLAILAGCMRLQKRIIDYIWVLFNPKYWIRLYPYNSQIDKMLLRKMQFYPFVKENKYTVKLDNINLWIANHPYASFTVQIGETEYSPARRTVHKLWEKFAKEIL